MNDLAVVEHVDVIGDFQAHPHVLLDEKDRDALVAHPGDDAEDLADDERRQALRRLVEDQEFRVEQQGAADRQHLLLAARELAAAIAAPLGETREKLIDARHGPRAGPLQRHQEIVVDAEIGEDLAPFWHVADTERGDAIGRPARRLLSEECDPSLARRCQPEQAAQRRRLAGAVAAEQRRDLAVGDIDADAVQDVALAVEGVQPLGGQRVHAAFPR
jgi:hypothetical protein